MATATLHCCSTPSLTSLLHHLLPSPATISSTSFKGNPNLHHHHRHAFAAPLLHIPQPRHHVHQPTACALQQQTSNGDNSPLPLNMASTMDQTAANERVLPRNLEDAVLQSTVSASAYVLAGGTRAIVELLFPELENLNEEGAQQRLWDLARLFLEELESRLSIKHLKAVFPDAGSAALLKYQWTDCMFKFASLNDRSPVSKEDEIIVLVAPDYQMLANVERIAASLVEDEDDLQPKPLILWNPHLSSGDVGIGLNVRRMRANFLRTFTVVYSLRPLPTGALFKSYPGIWQIFLEDKESPEQFLLVKEQLSRPNPDDIDEILLGGGVDDVVEEPSGLAKAVGMFASFNRFMKALSK